MHICLRLDEEKSLNFAKEFVLIAIAKSVYLSVAEKTARGFVLKWKYPVR